MVRFEAWSHSEPTTRKVSLAAYPTQVHSDLETSDEDVNFCPSMVFGAMCNIVLFVFLVYFSDESESPSSATALTNSA